MFEEGLKTSLMGVFEIRLTPTRIETSVVVSIEVKRDEKCDLLNFVTDFFPCGYIFCISLGLLLVP